MQTCAALSPMVSEEYSTNWLEIFFGSHQRTSQSISEHLTLKDRTWLKMLRKNWALRKSWILDSWATIIMNLQADLASATEIYRSRMQQIWHKAMSPFSSDANTAKSMSQVTIWTSMRASVLIVSPLTSSRRCRKSLRQKLEALSWTRYAVTTRARTRMTLLPEREPLLGTNLCTMFPIPSQKRSKAKIRLLVCITGCRTSKSQVLMRLLHNWTHLLCLIPVMWRNTAQAALSSKTEAMERASCRSSNLTRKTGFSVRICLAQPPMLTSRGFSIEKFQGKPLQPALSLSIMFKPCRVIGLQYLRPFLKTRVILLE